jgi:cyanate lyase
MAYSLLDFAAGEPGSKADEAIRPHRKAARPQARARLELETHPRKNRRPFRVLVVGAILGQMKLTKPQAAAAAELFGLTKTETALLNEVPMRGEGIQMPPTGPLIYRF